MNFLAHLYLSQAPPDLMVGNFIGDFVKGRAYENYPESVRKGILLHREIDLFTDENEYVRMSKRRLFPYYRHFSAVIVDMFYDHFLAAEWEKFHPLPLKDFAQQCYHTLKSNWKILPERAQYMIPFMIKDDWLKNYQEVSGISRALSGLSRRSSFDSKMEMAANELQEDYEIYRMEFHQFFPLIVNFTTDWKKANFIF